MTFWNAPFAVQHNHMTYVPEVYEHLFEQIDDPSTVLADQPIHTQAEQTKNKY